MNPRPVARRVARKELGLFFASPVAWLFLGAFAAASLFIFFWVSAFFARNIADVRPLFAWMPVLLVFLCSALTMRMWSEERRTGTLEHVLVQPAPAWRFVLGKFYACLALLALALVATLPLPVTVDLIADLDWGPVLAGYLASLLLGSAYIAVGLFVSARTDNPVVSLISSVAVCGLLFLVGSGLFTGFFPGSTAEVLRQFGTGARFNSITRGVIDLRDLFYYASLTAGFLALNVYTLERAGWARFASTPRQRHWRVAIALLLANLVVANLWLERFGNLRVDVTEGRLYSISDPTRELLRQLDEPLLIRGYFSARTHPLLSPLEPQLRDLIREYQEAGRGRVRVEFIDPATEPELEREANERFGIRPSPFQVADRYQSSLVNAYFHVVVQYGTEFAALDFSDLIEVRTATSGETEVMLRNPEFDITRAVRDVLYDYRAGGDLFAGIEAPVEFIGYVSDDERLPPALAAYRRAVVETLQTAQDASAGKFSYRFIDPEAGGGELASQISERWGFTPMAAAVDSDESFYFYFTLADKQQIVRLPTDDVDPGGFRLALDSGLKRFARNFTRSVALAVPDRDEQLAVHGLAGPSFANLERAITRDYNLLREDLGDGQVTPEADILLVIAPRNLDAASLFAIDQFLMRGGTIVLATSPFSVGRHQGRLELLSWESGLDKWLAHHGIAIGRHLVADPHSAKFPAPVRRGSGDYQFNDVRIIDYPFFVDVRRSNMYQHPATGKLPQLTIAWPSPVEVDPGDQRRSSRLLWTTTGAWLSEGDDIMPVMGPSGEVAPILPGDGAPLQSHTLGVLLQGRFDSYFTETPAIPAAGEAGIATRSATLIPQSPESARLLLFSSNDFLGDQVLTAQVRATGTQYLGPLELLGNTLDWALQEELLQEIRSRGHFNRTLPPMQQSARWLLEALNYGAALAWLGLLGIYHVLRRRQQRRRYARELGL